MAIIKYQSLVRIDVILQIRMIHKQIIIAHKERV